MIAGMVSNFQISMTKKRYVFSVCLLTLYLQSSLLVYSVVQDCCYTHNTQYLFILTHDILLVEYLWEYASNITEKRWCDQEKLNRVISVHLGAQWSLDNRRTQKCKTHMSHLCDVTGVTRTGLKVTLLSRWAVCRYCGLSRMEDYYIWHKQGKSRSQDDRQKAAEFGSVWFLRDNWKKIDKKTTHTRENWIHEITDSI